jgi:protein SCO1
MATEGDLRRGATALAALAVLALSGIADGHEAAGSSDPASGSDYVAPVPKAYEGIDVVEKLGTSLPRDLRFRDESGKSVTLGDYLQDKTPLLLTFNYSDCPMLCSYQLNALTAALPEAKLGAGWHYKIITVVLNPKETPVEAAKTKAKYLARFPAGMQGMVKDGWHFLLGDDATIHALAAAVGFGYKYVPERNEYAHPAVLIFASPNGTVTRYVHGTAYDASVLDQSIVAAGTNTPQESTGFLHRCFFYDPGANNYSGMAQNIMRFAAAGFLALMLAAFGTWRLVRRHRQEIDGSKETRP